MLGRGVSADLEAGQGFPRMKNTVLSVDRSNITQIFWFLDTIRGWFK